MMTEEYQKSKEGKPQLGNIDPVFLMSVSRVLEFGDNKHGQMDWFRNRQSFSLLVDALKRHLAEFELGRDYDEETGQHHMAHVGSIAMMLHAFDDPFQSAPNDDRRWKQVDTHPRQRPYGAEWLDSGVVKGCPAWVRGLDDDSNI